MKTKILLFLFILTLLSTLVYAQNLAYSIELGYKSGEISKNNLVLIDSKNEIRPVVGGEYDAKLYSFDDNLLFETSFNFELERTDEANPEWFNEEGKQIVVNELQSQKSDEISKVIFLPYYKSGKEVRIYRYKELKLTVDVSNLATCNNNGKCDNGETNKLCPEDCPNSEKMNKLSLWQRIINFIKNLFK